MSANDVLPFTHSAILASQRELERFIKFTPLTFFLVLKREAVL
jgi:hypothetical protein